MDINICINDFLKIHGDVIKSMDVSDSGKYQRFIIPKITNYLKDGEIVYTDNELSEASFRLWLELP